MKDDEKDDLLIPWRRGKVAEYLSKGYTQSDISKTLQVSPATISRDVEALRQEANQELKQFIENIGLEWKKGIISIDLLLKQANEMLESKTTDTDQRIDIMKLIANLVTTRLNIVGDSSALDKAYQNQAKLKAELEKLKKEKDATNYDIIEEAEPASGKKPEVTRRIVKKKKEEKPEIIV